jgi:23S rRNA pseudouridine1911/1915/1917 synthase
MVKAGSTKPGVASGAEQAEVSPPAAAPDGFVDVEFVVEPNYAGWRLDRYLCHKIRRLSRARVQRIIERSLISEKKLKASSLVQPGLRFTLRRRSMEEPETPTLLPEVFRDGWLLVLDKPAGLPIHPTARYHKGTLVTLVKERYGEDYAFPVHRLDRETSGLVVCGRSAEVCRSLMRAFVEGEVEKEYLAIAEGWPGPDALEVDAPISEGTELIRIAVRIDRQQGKPARTRFEVLRRFEREGERFALLRAVPRTGRQHQIRVHLKEAGFPVVGDKMYGPDERYFDRFTRHQLDDEAWARLRLPRHALHAARIRFRHPGSGDRVGFESPLPEDLEAFLAGR